MRLAADLREAVYLSALNGSLSERRLGENTEQFHSSFSGEEPFPVPDSWKWCCFSDVVTIATNLVDPKDYQNYLQIAPDYIEKGTGILKPCNTVGANKIISKNHLFRAGQIIYSKIRPALRKAVIAPFDGLCSADMYPLETELDTHYLLFFLLSDFFTKKAVEKSAREKMPKINQKELGKLPIPVPPVEEQQRIVERVKEILPEINEYEEMENRLVSLKEEFPRNLRISIIMAALQGKLTDQLDTDGSVDNLIQTLLSEKGEFRTKRKARAGISIAEIKEDEYPFDIPPTWRFVRIIDSVKNIVAGGDKPKKFSKAKTSECPVEVISNGETNNGVFGYTDTPTIKERSLTVSARGTIGYSVIRETPYVPIVRLLVLLPLPHTNLEYLKYVLEGMLETGSGTAVKQLTVPMISPKVIPLPPLEEQQRIVDRLNALLPMCYGLADVI